MPNDAQMSRDSWSMSGAAMLGASLAYLSVAAVTAVGRFSVPNVFSISGSLFLMTAVLFGHDVLMARAAK